MVASKKEEITTQNKRCHLKVRSINRVICYTGFFYISNTFISNARLKLAKIKQMPSNILRLKFCYLKIILIRHPRYHPKTGLGQSGRVRDKSTFFTKVRESQGKPWKVRDNVRKSWTELKRSGTILEKWAYLLNFGLVFQKLVYLYS